MTPLPPNTTIVLLCPPTQNFPGLGFPSAAWIPLAGRPLIYRALDLWAERKASKVVVVRSPSDANLWKAFLKKGEAWGLRLEFADWVPGMAASVSELSRFAPENLPWAGGSVERWPLGDLPAVGPASQILAIADSPVPLGWFLAGPQAAQYPERATVAVLDTKILAAATAREALDSLRIVFEEHHPGLVVSAEERTEGVFFSAKVKLGAGVKLLPPVFLGEGCRIGDGSVIGPFASLEEGTIVGRDCHIEDSIVLGRPVLGDHLDIQGLVIKGDTLLNSRNQAHYAIGDPSLIRRR